MSEKTMREKYGRMVDAAQGTQRDIAVDNVDLARLLDGHERSERDNGARLALSLADGDLETMEQFFREHMDEGGPECTHYNAVRRVIALLIRMRDGKSLPTTYPTYAMNGEDL